MKFVYRFTLPRGKAREFEVTVDDQTCALVPEPRSSYPKWTRLTYKQCSNCTLREEQHPRCPIAASMADLTEFFRESYSWEKADVEVRTPERTFSKRASVAEGIRSLVGIYMVTSGCPILDKLRPMVRTHLPFGTWEETLYRAVSMYLLAQFFLAKRGEPPDWELKKMSEACEAIAVVNKTLCERLRDTSLLDAVLNALVELDCFAQMAAKAARQGKLPELEKLFTAYWTR